MLERGRHLDRSGLATTALVLMTAAWGSTFFLIRDLVRTVPSADFLGVRFGMAAFIMVVLFHRQLRSLTRRQLLAGLLIGALYGLAQIFQTVGLEHTSASVSGFITGMYVVLTPVFAWLLLRERISATVWFAVSLATAGLALLSLNGFAVGRGEVLTLVGAAVYALQILAMGRWSSADAAIGLATAQLIAIAVLCGAVALPGGVTWPQGAGQWTSMIYMVLIPGIGAILGQTWAQAHMSATRAAIIMTLEPVFAAGFAVAFGGERPTVRMIVGGLLVLAAMYAVELRSRPLPVPVEPAGLVKPPDAPQ